MWMGLLLKFEGYPPGVLFAVLLHSVVLWFLLDRDLSPDNQVKIEPPTYITATTTRDNPQRLRRIEQIELQRQKDQDAARRKRETEQRRQAELEANRKADAAKKAEAERQRVAEAQRQSDQRRAEAAKKAEQEKASAARAAAAAEAERKRQAEALRQAQIKADAERQAAAEAKQQSVEDELVGRYTNIIRQLISQNWVLAANARNGMTVVIELNTTPVGDITRFEIVQSSGDATFDRSVLQAVARVGNLQELRDLPPAVYERNFRHFLLTFMPEDLLR